MVLSCICSLALSAASTQAGPVSEFIFTSAPFQSCHASTIVELRNGDLLAAWFGGSDEGKPDVAIWGARRSGGQWSTPVLLVREPETPAWNPVLFSSRDERLWLYYKFGPSPGTWTGGRMWSQDDGQTWSEREHLPAGLYGPIKDKPLVLDDGAIVSGTSVESYRSWAVWIERSSDNGKSWTKFGPITVPSGSVRTRAAAAVPAQAKGAWEWKHTYGIIQPAIVSMGGDRLRLYARSTSSIGAICVADSLDRGVTWTPARPIDLPNPDSGIDAVRLQDGRIVLAYNNTKSGRTPLNLAVSRDGEHFQMFSVLEKQPGEYSYPAIIQGRDGDLHITYTWNRTRIRYVRLPLAEVPKCVCLPSPCQATADGQRNEPQDKKQNSCQHRGQRFPAGGLPLPGNKSPNVGRNDDGRHEKRPTQNRSHLG
jgi:predicted neuraminidase